MAVNIPADFFIFTSIRYEPTLDVQVEDPYLPYYLLPFHLARLRSAAADFGLVPVQELLENDTAGLNLLTAQVDAAVSDRSKPWRVNIKFSPDSQVSASATSISPAMNKLLRLPGPLTSPEYLTQEASNRKLTAWDVAVDNVPTPASPFTNNKTSVRGMYAAARDRAQLVSIDAPHEVLLWNENREVTEGSITTVYLWRTIPGATERQLVTPKLSCGSNASSTRRYALSKGLCIEGVVKVNDLKDGDEVWLSHASDGFFPGRLRFLSK